MKSDRKIKKPQVVTFRKKTFINRRCSLAGHKILWGKEMKTSYVLSATGTLGDKLYYGSLCQYMSKHLIVVFFFSHRYNTVPHLLHVSQESLGLDKQNSNNTASHLSFSNHMLAFHG